MKAFEEEIGDTLDFNFTEAFRSWELQAGYPEIDVRYDHPTQSFYITQRRYLQGFEKVDSEDTPKWFVPLSFTTQVNPNFENTQFTDYFDDTSKTFKVISTKDIEGRKLD